MLSNPQTLHPELYTEPSVWHAVQTKSHFEKVVAEQLSKKSIEAFLPTRQVLRRWSDRKKLIEEPLFRGYVFVRPSERQHTKVLCTTGVVRYIGTNSATPSIVPESEMRALQKFVEQDIKVDPYPYLKKGQRVIVKHGPMKGIEGFIVKKPRFCRLVISVELMMQSVAVEIDQSDVESI